MGYYSEVKICVKKDVYTNLLAKVVDKELDVNLFDKDVLDFYQEFADGEVVFGWNWIKWYPSFSEVRFIEENILNQDISYQFIRIGEEREDIEYRDNMIDEDDFNDHIEPMTTVNVY